MAFRAGRQALQQQQERSMSRKVQKPKKVTPTLLSVFCNGLFAERCEAHSARNAAIAVLAWCGSQLNLVVCSESRRLSAMPVSRCNITSDRRIS